MVVSVCFGLFQNSLFRLFHFYTETESFDVSIEPRQTEEQPKQFDTDHILAFLIKSYGCFGLPQTETNRNFILLVSRNKPKHN